MPISVVSDLTRAVDKFDPQGDPFVDRAAFEVFQVQLEALSGDGSIAAAIAPATAAALPGIFLRSLRAAIKPPRGPAVFMPLHTALLLMRDALALDGALMKLLVYPREHRAALAVSPLPSTLAAVSGRVLPAPPPPPQPASVAEPERRGAALTAGMVTPPETARATRV